MKLSDKINQFLPPDKPLPDTGILLVGSNPLPVYTVIKALMPSKIFLLGTSDVLSYLDELEQVLAEEGFNDVKLSVTMSTKVYEIRQSIRSILKCDSACWFSYTGGTKVMAVHAYEAWKEKTGHGHWAVYLSPYGPSLYLPGIIQPDKSFLLAGNQEYDVPKNDFLTIAKLHLFKKKNFENSYQNDFTADLSNRIHTGVVSSGIHEYLQLLPPVHEKIKTAQVRNGIELEVNNGELSLLCDKNYNEDSLLTKWDLTNYLEKLQIALPDRSLDGLISKLRKQDVRELKNCDRRTTRKKGVNWLATKWLECWVAQVVNKIDGFHLVIDGCEFYIPNSNKGSKKEETEIDACAMRGVTPYFFSCTTDGKKSLTKHKLMEVRHRATQIGGDHARAALICFAEDETRIKEIEAQLNQGWQGYGTIKVFGLPDIQDAQTFTKKINEWVDFLEQLEGVA